MDILHCSSRSGRWGALLFALATPLLCSCRAPMAGTLVETSERRMDKSLKRPMPDSADHPTIEPSDNSSLPPVAYTGYPGDGFTRAGAVPAHMRPPGWEPPPAVGPPLPRMVYGPWAPAGIAVPWPTQEYLCDGGDKETHVIVRDDWRVDGLDDEDTIAHYDTVDGRTLVEPSNQVCLYAPRFSSVRRVDNVFEGEQQTKASGHTQPVSLIGYEEKQLAATNMQPIQPIGDRAAWAAGAFKARDLGQPLFTVLMPAAVHDRLKPHENFAIFQAGLMKSAEKPLLAQAVQAALVWETKQAAQIILEGKRAQADVLVQSPAIVYRVDLPGNPKLRLCKTASATSALPGEEVDFTLRFDNVGNQTIGNVTIIDNLTTRLEYIPDSAKSSVKAEFSVEANYSESLTLRWEIAEPLKPGDGGLVRFKCRVR
jgi:uncharacterized repeat protein (TIGR01451 family)